MHSANEGADTKNERENPPARSSSSCAAVVAGRDAALCLAAVHLCL